MNNIFFNQNSGPALELEDLIITFLPTSICVTANSLSPVKSDLEISLSLLGVGISSIYPGTCTILMDSGSKTASGVPDFNTAGTPLLQRVTINSVVINPSEDKYYKYIASYS